MLNKKYDLNYEAKIKRRAVLSVSFSFIILFGLELVAIFNSQGRPSEVLNILSFVIALGGCLYTFTLHYLFFKSQKNLVQRIVNKIGKRSISIEPYILKKIFSEDIFYYLRTCYVFIPRFHKKNNEVLISPIDGLSDFLNNHQQHIDLDTVTKAKNDILKNTNDFKFSFLDLVADALIFVFPFAVMSVNVFDSNGSLLFFVASFRVATVLFYFTLYKNMYFNGDTSLRKLDVFINTDLTKESEAMSTRIDFKSILEESANNVFMIVSENRKSEVKQAIRYLISNDEEHSDWKIFSLESEKDVDIKEETPKNLIVIFPSELKHSHTALVKYIDKSEKVIVIDTSPSLALSDSVVYYIDHDQRVKKVKASENIDRFSGDKGLILKSLDDNSNLKGFLNHLKDRIKEDAEPLYLVFKDITNSEAKKLDKEKAFLYPSNKHAVFIENNYSKSDADEKGDMYCKLDQSNKLETVDQARSFIANCTYHRILKGQNKKAL